MSPIPDGEPVYVRVPEAQVSYFFDAPVDPDGALTLYNACDLQDEKNLQGFEITPVLPSKAKQGEGSVVEVYKNDSKIPSTTVVHRTNMDGVYAKMVYDTDFHPTDPLAFSGAVTIKLGANKNAEYLASLSK